MRYAPRVQGQLLLDGTMGRIGRMGRMIMGQGDKGTVLWGTMGLWDSTMHHAPRTTHFPSCTLPPAPFLDSNHPGIRLDNLQEIYPQLS